MLAQRIEENGMLRELDSITCGIYMYTKKMIPPTS